MGIYQADNVLAKLQGYRRYRYMSFLLSFVIYLIIYLVYLISHLEALFLNYPSLISHIFSLLPFLLLLSSLFSVISSLFSSLLFCSILCYPTLSYHILPYPSIYLVCLSVCLSVRPSIHLCMYIYIHRQIQ